MSVGLFVGVMEPGTLIYIGVPDRAAFDRIARPCTDHAPKNLLTKTVDADGIYIVFQHWLLERTALAESNRGGTAESNHKIEEPSAS
jgi:hypothetical protein